MSAFAVVFPAYNEEAYLPATLAAARLAMAEVAAEFGPGELVVVDNNSRDRTAEVAREHGADRVVFEPHKPDRPGPQRRSRRDRGGVARLLDADTRLTASLLRQGLAALASGTVAAGGARVAMDREVTPMVAWIVRLWDRVATTFTYAAGSFFFTRRDAFEAAGGFDETVYAGEEVWLAKRIKVWAKKRGLVFRVLPEPVVTSARKSDWFSTKDFLAQLAVIFLIPGATRSRRLCAIWYRRPESAGPETLTKPSPVSE